MSLRKPTILLTGKTGQVGSELNQLLPEFANVIAPGRNELDLADVQSIRRVIDETRPQIIVNAAAYTAVDAAEKDEANAFAINAKAPAVLAEQAKRLGALLVHYSTDYVFDGTKRSPYSETDATNPLNVYGKSKLAGEQAICESGAFHLIFRTSWVYSTRGKNFLLTILRLATEREELKVVSDQIGAPTRALYIARATAQILANIFNRNETEESISSLSGTYHMTASGETSWHEFAQAILEEARGLSHPPEWLIAINNGRLWIAKRVLAISTEEFASATPRPLYSVLANARFAQVFGFTLPDWREQLQSCFRFTPQTAQKI